MKYFNVTVKKNVADIFGGLLLHFLNCYALWTTPSVWILWQILSVAYLFRMYCMVKNWGVSASVCSHLL